MCTYGRYVRTSVLRRYIFVILVGLEVKINAKMSEKRASCCPEGAIPFLKEDPNYVVKGEMIEYDGIQAYRVGSGSKCVMMIHDIFGMQNGMHRLLCDKLSEGLPGYTIIAPNFFRHGNIFGDDPLPQRGIWIMPKLLWLFVSCQFNSTVQKISWENSAGEAFNKTTAYLKQQGVTAIATIGFCYGTYIGFKASLVAEHKDLIFANISFHPSVSGLAPKYHENEMDIVNAAHCPQLVASTMDEPASWRPGGIIEKTLKDKAFGEVCEFYDYPGEHHGFMVRGETKIEATRVAIEDGLNKAVRFVEKTCPK